jgi:adenine-specific DNA-methyltransferase
MPPKPPKSLTVDTLAHEAARRRNIPTAELEPVLEDDVRAPVRVAYARRNRDLDPQLVWRGKDEQDWSDLVVQAPPLFIQEKVHPKVLVDDLLRRTAERRAEPAVAAPDLFAFYDGLPDREARAEAYQHEGNWQNRMILGDSLQVMASLAEREGLRGKVQAIYFDPPYGIRFNSNFQWSTTSRDVKDGDRTHLTREPEQVKAFRDTWRDGIHSYLTYLRDRLTIARDLLTDSGSIFVQIGDENVHRVRALMDEVFGEENFCGQISFSKTSGQTSQLLATGVDYIIWFSKHRDVVKFRKSLIERKPIDKVDERYVCVETDIDQVVDLSIAQKSGTQPIPDGRILKLENLTSQSGTDTSRVPFEYRTRLFRPGGSRGWSTHTEGLKRVGRAGYLWIQGNTLWWKSYRDQGRVTPRLAEWHDTRSNAFGDERIYVVQTNVSAVEHCLLMATDPGDLVLDPTCGSGTTAYVAEQWGRRWITIDTSRVALALARARIMGARYPWYILADSPEGQRKEAEETRTAPKTTPTRGDIRQGFVYQRVPHVTLKSIANNAEIDVIWERFQAELEPLRTRLNVALGTGWAEWEIPREADPAWPADARAAHAAWWERRIARQREIDASIAAKAEVEYLFDKPYPDPSRVRVAGPFTVESLSPHRTLAVGADDELVDLLDAAEGRRVAPGREGGQRDAADFPAMVIEHLKAAGVQQAHKADRITFTSLVSWPGAFVAAEGRYVEGGPDAGTGEGAAGSEAKERRAGILIGPEFGTVSRPDLVAAAREAADAGFDVLIACAFNFDAHASEFEKLGRIKVLKARMNADLHMGGELKATGSGNLFVVFGEPDIVVEDAGKDAAGAPLIRVRIRGVDIFKPSTGEVESGGPETIAVWFLDTDYDRESFFVRHAYFPGASSDPYKALKTTLKAEIDEEAWATLNSDVSRPFPKPKSGRIAVKVINHLGDEVMKVFQVG